MKFQTLILSALLLVSSSAAQVQTPVNKAPASNNNKPGSVIGNFAKTLINKGKEKVNQAVNFAQKQRQVQAPNKQINKQPTSGQKQVKKPVTAPLQKNNKLVNNKPQKINKPVNNDNKQNKPAVAPVNKPTNNANQKVKRGFFKTALKVGKGIGKGVAFASKFI